MRVQGHAELQTDLGKILPCNGKQEVRFFKKFVRMYVHIIISTNVVTLNINKLNCTVNFS